MAFGGLLVDLDVHDRFRQRAIHGLGLQAGDLAFRIPLHADYRVDDQTDLGIELIELGNHGVDQERHVVVDDLDHRVAGLVQPCALETLGCKDPNLGLGRIFVPPLSEVQAGKARRAVEVLRRGARR